MDTERLVEAVNTVLSRARAELSHDIEKHRKDVNALVHEKANAQTTLSSIREQIAQAKRDLTAVMNHLGPASTLVSLRSDIEKDSKTIETLTLKKAELEKAIEALTKQRAETETQVLALVNELSGLRSEGAQIEVAKREFKTLLAQVQLPQV
jgi:chromosome segregation ATPase